MQETPLQVHADAIGKAVATALTTVATEKNAIIAQHIGDKQSLATLADQNTATIAQHVKDKQGLVAEHAKVCEMLNAAIKERDELKARLTAIEGTPEAIAARRAAASVKADALRKQLAELEQQAAPATAPAAPPA